MMNYDEIQSVTDPANPGSVIGACSDGIDDDGDGTIDLADTGCPSASGRIENPECSDGFDNDGDGTADFVGDPDCTAAVSIRELALPTRDCRLDPANGLLGFMMIFLALRFGTRRRSA